MEHKNDASCNPITGRVGHFIEFQGVKISHSPEESLPPSLMFWHVTCVFYSLHFLLGLVIFVLIRRTPSGEIFLLKTFVVPAWYFFCIILWQVFESKLLSLKFKHADAFPEDKYSRKLQLPNLWPTSSRHWNQPDLPLAFTNDDVQYFADSETLRQLLPEKPAGAFLRNFRRRWSRINDLKSIFNF